MPVSTFVEAFPNFSIAHYKQWYVSNLTPQLGYYGTISYKVQSPVNQKIIVTLDLVPEIMSAAGCSHNTGNIILVVMDGSTMVGRADAFSRSTPSVNVHVSGAGTYQIDIYSYNSGESGSTYQYYDYNLHVYAEQQTAPILNM